MGENYLNKEDLMHKYVHMDITEENKVLEESK
jgi:hypothetical protein